MIGSLIYFTIFTFTIVPQPVGEVTWVSLQPNEVTYFTYVGQWGVEAYIAHDYLAGEMFRSLHNGYEVFANGVGYTVVDIVYLYPGSPEHESEIFEKYYGSGGIGDGRLILQTCIGSGFMFIIAEKNGKLDENAIGLLVGKKVYYSYISDKAMKKRIIPRKLVEAI